MAKILKQEKISRFTPKNSNTLSSRNITRKFGKSEDFVDIFIYDLSDNLLQSFPNFKDYSLPELTSEGSLVNELDFDFENILNSLGYKSGSYKIIVNIQRRKIFNTTRKIFRIKSISSTRTELSLVTSRTNKSLEENSRDFMGQVQNSPLFRDFILNFGKNNNILGVNIALDKSKSKYEVLIKTFEPLPLELTEGDTLIITEELIEPVVVTYDLGLPQPRERSTALRGPNFKIDTRLNDAIPTSLKSYNDILSTDTTSSYQKLLSKLEGYEIPEIDYAYIRPLEGSSSLELGELAPSHFENFVHFGSAIERLKNFEYKLKLVELYDTKLKETRTLYGDVSQSSTVLAITASFQSKKEKLIQDFDGYERFLYYESGAYSWPKTNTSEPYIQAHTTSSNALNWLGSTNYNSPYLGGQLESASIYDSQNYNNLINTIPNHIGDKVDNEPYLLFCNMIGNFFDPIWAHIKEITQIRDNNHTYGISKNLVYYALTSLGIDAYDQFENNDLINYMFGSTLLGGDEHKTEIITGSNDIVAKQDITKEIWKRLYHNAPYLLKTKGTARGLQALISCYGISDTILNVKEYGGSKPSESEAIEGQLYTHNKYYKALTGHSDDPGVEGFFIQTGWSNNNVKTLSASAKTVEFRIQPHRSGSDYHLFSLTGSNSGSDLHMQLHPYTGSFDFFEQGDKTKFGKIELIQYSESIASSSGFLPNNGLGKELFKAGNYVGKYSSSLGEYEAIDEDFTINVPPNTPGGENEFKTNGQAQILDGVGWIGGVDPTAFPSMGGLGLGLNTIQPDHIYEIEIEVLSTTGSSGQYDAAGIPIGTPNTYLPQATAIAISYSGGQKYFTIPNSESPGKHKLKFAAPDGLTNWNLFTWQTNGQTGVSQGTYGPSWIYDSYTKLGNIKIQEINLPISPTYYQSDNSNEGIAFHGFQIKDDAVYRSGSSTAFTAHNSSIRQDIQINEGAKYEVSYDRKWESGDNRTNVFIDNDGNGTPNTFASLNEQNLNFKTVRDTFTAGYTGILTISLYAIGNFNGYLNNITVKEVTTESEYFPIYNGRFWNINIGTEGISGSSTTCSFGAYQSNHVREVSAYTSSVVLSEKTNAQTFGNPYYSGGDYNGGAGFTYHGGIKHHGPGMTIPSNYNTTSTASFDLKYSGSLNEIRYYVGELLSHDTLKTHALDPLIYAGNSVSSSYDTLVTRLPLAFELEEIQENDETFIPSSSVAWNTNPTADGVDGSASDQDILDLNTPITGGAIITSSTDIQDQPGYPNHTPLFTVAGTPLLRSHHPNESIAYMNSFTYMTAKFNTGYEETHHQMAPSTVGRSMINDKIRIDSGSIDDDILSGHTLSQTPAVKRQPKGFSDVGVFYSPQNELNEDIIYTLGRFSMDDTLGDPRHASSPSYPDLTELSNQYFKKLHKGTGRLNTFDFIRLIQFTDYTLFELIKKFTPEKANLKTGLLIEPHYLERSKFKRYNPSLQHTFSPTSSLYEAVIKDIDSPLTASFSKNNNIADLGPKTRLSGSAVMSYTTTKYPDKELANNFEKFTKHTTGITLELQNSVSPITGNSDIRFKNVAGSGNQGFRSNAIHFKSGSQYRVSFNVKINNGALRYKIANAKTHFGGTHIGNGGGYANRDSNPFNTTNEGTKTAFNNTFIYVDDAEINFITFFGDNGLDAQIDDFSITEVGTPDKVRGNQIDYNTTIDVNDYYNGISDLEHGPIKPKYKWSLSFNHLPDGTSLDDYGVTGFRSEYGTAGDERIIEGGRLKLVKPTTQNNGALTPDIGFEVGCRYRFTVDTTGNPGVISPYHGDTRNSNPNTGAAGYVSAGSNSTLNNSGHITGSIFSRLSTGTGDFPADTEGTGSINWEFEATKPFYRFYIIANRNGSTAGTTFFDNFKIEKLGTKKRSSGKIVEASIVDSSNDLRSWTLTPYGNYSNSTISKKVFKTVMPSPELIINGNFETDIHNWNIGNSTSTHYVEWTPNGARFVSPTTTPILTFGYPNNLFELKVGETYELIVVITDKVGAGGIKIDKTSIPGVLLFNTGGTFKYTISPTANTTISFYRSGTDVDLVIKSVSLKEITTKLISEKAEFNDSLLDLTGWKNSRYNGSKLTGAKIGKYTDGDITYGLNPVADQKSTTLYFGKSLIGAEGEDDNLTTIKNHSYVDIEKIMLIDKYTDRVTIIDLKNENYKGANGYIANDFKNGSSFNIELLDDKITHQLKDSYKAKFNQGYLKKVVEHKGIDGGGSVTNEGIQAGYIHSSASSLVYNDFDDNQNIFCYGNHGNTMNSSTLILKENTLTKEIWPVEDTFGLVDFVTSSTNYVYSSMQNLSSFYNSMLVPVASESQYRLFTTFNHGQPIAVADYSSEENAGIRSISTCELDLEKYEVDNSEISVISINMEGFAKDLSHPKNYIIPIMQGPHNIITTKKEGAGTTWPDQGGNTGGKSGYNNLQLQYYFSGDSSRNAIYQISYLEETNVIIANIDKPTELTNDVGDGGYVLIPNNIDKDIKNNLSFFLDKAGLKENIDVKRIPNKKE